MKFPTIILLILSAAVSVFPATAQNRTLTGRQRATRYYNAPPNLTSNLYTDFCQDNSGFIWIATETGLMRFDGFNLETYRSDKSREGTISDNRVNRVYCDSRGNIWVGTSNGLNLFDPTSETFKVVKLPPSEKLHGYVQDIAEQQDGTIIFNVAGNGLYLVDPDEPAEATRLSTNGPRFEGNSLHVASNRKIFLGTHRGNLQVISRNGNITEIDISDSHIGGISHEQGSRIIVYGQNKICRVDTKDNSVDEIDISALNGTIINKIRHDKEGNGYIASNSGLWLLRNGAHAAEKCDRFFNSTVALDNIKIGAVYSAPDGNIWIGCNYKGVVMAPTNPLPFDYHPISARIPEFKGGISALAVNNFGTWTALEEGNLLHIMPGGKSQRIISIPGAGTISKLTLADNGIFYAATSNAGLWTVDPRSGDVRKLTELPNYASRYGLDKRENDNTLFISVIGHGLIMLDTESSETQTITSSTPGIRNFYSDWISSSMIDSKGRLWLGSFSAMSCLDTKTRKFKEIDQTPFLSMSIHGILESNDGKILLGTSDGLLVYNPEKDVVERKVTNTDGLAGNDIRCLELDNRGTVWIGTMLGISYYDPKTGAISSIRGGYGLSETALMYSTYHADFDEMVFAGNLGYTTFRPADVSAGEMQKPLYISGIYLNGSKLTLADTTEGDPTLTPDPARGYSKAIISHSDNNMLVKVSTMDFRDPENVVIERKLDNGQWLPGNPGNSSLVIPKLLPGDYTLYIRASDNGRVSEPTVLKIHVTSPWYASLPAKIFYLLAGAGILVLLFVLYRKKDAERLNEAKVKFFMDISHEIRSPMTCIISPLESLMKKDHDPETKRLLNSMHRNAGRILSLANQLLEIRKIDKGKKILSMRPTDPVGFTEEIIDLYRQMAESKRISISLEAEPRLPEVWIDRANFDKVLVNLITNAIKYTPDHGRIIVAIRRDSDETLGECLRLSVTDTGTGIDPRNIEKIFDRFYQGSGSASGFGVGLDLARQIAVLHHGTLTAANRTDGVKGSVFTVSVPLGKTHLSSRETAEYDTRELPAMAPAIPLVTSAENAIIKTTAPARTSLSRRILIVDDDFELLDYLCDHYSKFVRVERASDGAEAMKILLSKKIDLVISDVMMPRMDGITLLRTIKANVDTSHIPVVLLSTRGDVADRMAGWSGGADGYVGKPFDISELDAIVDNFIENRLRIKGKYSGVHDTTDKITVPEIKGNDETLLERVMKAIETHLDDSSFNVENLSEEVGISRAHLHRRLKELAGMSPSDFIKNVKIKRACDMLKKQDVDVSQVAFCLGFSSQPHFSTTFKRFTGMTPSEYRLKVLQPAPAAEET